MRRVSPAKKKRLLTEAEVLAYERAKLFRLQRRVGSGPRKGEALTGHKLHKATSTRSRNALIEKGAKPVLSSSEWRTIYGEVGL